MFSRLRARRRQLTAIPGFGLTLGLTITALSLVVLIPLSGIFLKTAAMSPERFWAAVGSPRALAAYRVSFGCALTAAVVNAFFGLLIAWTLVRYRFPGKRLLDAMVDLPFALPTAVAGIALTSLYAPNGLIGAALQPLGVEIAFGPAGILVALIFIGIPFVVRTVQPVLEDLDRELEEAAASLGASRWQTFTRVLLPQIAPALLTGFTLAFARALGEYGSVIFIGGNIPKVSEIVPLLIVIRLEQYDYPAAAALALVMLVASFILFFVINVLQRWSQKRGAPAR